MTSVPLAPSYNPAQQAVLDQLGAAEHDRPAFAADLRDDLRAELEDELAVIVPLLDELGVSGDEPLFVSKRVLEQVHACEEHLLASRAEGFPGWSVPLARGQVAHKAIELSIHVAGEPAPAELVDRAIERLAASERGLGEWLATLGDIERAELRAEATDRVTKFVECWPRLKPTWRPVTESSLRAELLGGRVVLQGKVDLTLGRAEGNRAGKVLVDLKTGAFSPHHLDDLRFYALLEVLRLGVPPRLLTTYYLDKGDSMPEPVTEGLLRAAVARTAQGAVKLVELRCARREAVARPGAACRWCPVAATCEPGRAFLDARDDW